MDLLKGQVKIPCPSDKVYKDECVLSFDNPETPTGLYVSLKSFLGFGVDYVGPYYQQTGHSVFLKIRRIKHKLPADLTENGPDKKITRLAIGTPDGFNPDAQKYSYEDLYEIVILPDFKSIPYPNKDLPADVQEAIEKVLQAESAFQVAEKEALTGTWDGEARITTKHTDLIQLDNGKKIPPSGWKCEMCDLTNNLWLNLSDGSILCGRKFFDGTGGNDHAVEHYAKTGYPLAVKLGTISREGKADVYSYDEDDMVEDPNLAIHLAHWGINITTMEKTEKSMVELEVELNQKFGEWIAQQEGTNQLSPVSGPGYTGLVNLGSSCYMNSVLQMFFAIPDFVERFVTRADEIFYPNVVSAPNNFNVQMAKLGVGLVARKPLAPQSEEDNEPKGISPRMFKTLIGKGHPGFASNRQQDAQEFILHLINVIEKNSRHQANPTDCFKFLVEERYQCSSGKVKYTRRPEYLLPLPIPMDAVLNKEEVAAYEKSKTEEDRNKYDPNLVIRPRIKLTSCLESFANVETVEQFYSTALNDKTTATKTTRLASFPDYLMIHLKKFTVREDWTCVKLDVAVEMPDILDLNHLRGNGLQPNEEVLPEASQLPQPPVYDQALLSQLVEMGFPVEACKKALFFTENRGMEAASQWLMEHISDNDFSDTFIPPGVDSSMVTNNFVPNQEALDTVMNIGFTKEQAMKALRATQNNVERAIDWVFCHMNELDSLTNEVSAPSSASQEPKCRDGNGMYKLVGFITHMGTSTMVGHYVCHLLKDGKWIIYNDEKVFVSEKPAKELGYIYLYQRMDIKS